MTDVFDKAKRSEVMSKIKSKNTRAELIVFKYLNKNHVYYKKHYERAPGKPDIALARKKRAIFIDGDFWHGRTIKALQKRRGSKTDYWVLKIGKNIERDITTRKLLTNNGWQILAVWESDILRKRTRDEELLKILAFLRQE